jgi:hypothetical protein
VDWSRRHRRVLIRLQKGNVCVGRILEFVESTEAIVAQGCFKSGPCPLIKSPL